ncbi:efflux RND transporter permease subunit [Comamonas sp. NLF-1-9]|uniref:efflux RND transporter permease subunit n=1 Tax=Comamonas sp. NLF-1-9 TaxID=2853163 RepID=UPI001C446CE5|nr:efflux RND transporter permease subunit [Comamonas sp. NLF-1-9]QXL85006.1 efflux RND transporter permease subunit [Comamonas sp. NLF-1-9]
MNVSRLFIRRPVATALFMLAIVLAGLVGLRFLPLAALPQVDYPTIQVQTLYPGASPDVMSRTVTAPLERQFGQMPGLSRMGSVSSAGVSMVTLQFDLQLPMDAAEQQVQAAMNAAGSLLPADLPAPPIYAKVNPADAPILQLAVTSTSLPLTEVQNMVNTRLALKISQINGVGLVTLAGGQRPAVRVQGNVEQLASMGLGLDAISSAIAAGNASGAKGSFDGPKRQYSINANDQLLSAEDYRELIIAYVNGQPVRLKDVARVIDGSENDRLGAWTGIKNESGQRAPGKRPELISSENVAGVQAPHPSLSPEGRGRSAAPDSRPLLMQQEEGRSSAPDSLPLPLGEGRGEGRGASSHPADYAPPALTPAIIINVQRQPGANVIATVDAIKRQLPLLEQGLPESVHLAVLSDRTLGIRASVEHVQLELLLAVVMVVLVIFAFLHSLRATLVASIAVPISLLGTVGAMYLLGYSLNNLSLMALTIATGFVVDDAIVMIENIARHREMGKPPLQAALEGAGEIGFTIISLTVSLIAVLIPLLFMQEVIGRLFREFAVTLAITILFSALVSLTLVPMMSARMLQPLDAAQGRVARWLQAGSDALIARYDRALVWVLRHQVFTLWLALATFAVTALLYVLIPKDLFPTQSTGQLQGRVQAASDVSFARMSALQGEVARLLLADPAVASLSSVVGVDASNNAALSSGRLVVNLRPRALFGESQAQTMQRLRQQVAQEVAGVQLYLQPTQDLSIDADTGPTQYRFDLEGVDAALVDAWAQKLSALIAELPELRHATTDAGRRGPAAMVRVDRDSAARLGVSASALDNTLYNAFGQRIVSTIFSETNQYRVILEAARTEAASLQTLRELPVKTSSGASTPLSSFADVVQEQAPLTVQRVGQYPAATVGFDTAPGVSLGAAVQAVRMAAEQAGLPAAITLRFTGAAGAYQKSLANQLWLILAAVVCVYIVLGVLYESYVHPLTILSTLPSAGVGALLALQASGHALDVVSIIGLVLLIGIVKKNAIMMIDFAIDAERGQGLDASAAIHQAALLRFRPILMTTLAALAAAVPLMLSWGDGAELRRPLGIAIFGGLVLSQLLTLFTTPVIYIWFDRLGARLAGAGGLAGAGVQAAQERGRPARAGGEAPRPLPSTAGDGGGAGPRP